MKLLSFDGRLTLIKSVFSSLPVYFLSIFKMPVGVVNGIQASFIWGDFDLKKKIHMVRWDEMSKGIKLGGLRVRRLTDINSCALAKRWWQFGMEEKGLNEIDLVQ
ncbi:hypothetical protein CsSME_00018052 [Camellia sinensis var. sinensis]